MNDHVSICPHVHLYRTGRGYECQRCPTRFLVTIRRESNVLPTRRLSK